MTTRQGTSAARAFNRIYRKAKARKTLLLVLSCFVVFITTYMLILPAVTLDQEEAERQGGIDVTTEQAAEITTEDSVVPEDSDATEERAVSEDAAPAGAITFEGKGYQVQAECKDADLPDGTEIVAEEIDKKDKDFDALYEDALSAVQKESENKTVDFAFAKFYDISLLSDGESIEPDNPVNVTISYDKALKASDADNLRIVHFAVDKETGEVTPEVLDPAQVNAEIKNDKMTAATFEAASFSVYAVVYTVDFSYEVNGKAYSFTMKGEDSVSLRALIEALHVYEKTAAEVEASVTSEDLTDKEAELEGAESNQALNEFLSDIDSVEFSNPELLAVCKVEEDSTLGKLKFANGIDQKFSHLDPQEEVIQRNSVEYSAGDWALISLKPFDSKEELIITLKTGERFTITVTDAKDAVMNPDGTTVQTISNPAGTTIDLFDYWVDTDLRYNDGRMAWPGFSDGWNPNEENLGGTGNEAGINAEHALKFSPAWEHTVINGTTGTHNVNGANGLNSYTGGTNPFPGIVQSSLDEGYPKLTTDPAIGSDGESLAYLFNPNVPNDYKASYTGVNQLLYVDKDGYYTFDSRDYYARYNEGSKTFTVTEQTTNDPTLKGFWPFNDQDSGTRNFWVGMHVNTQFSMPAGGQVLNPSNELKPMQFEFSGDDDVWIYVDGVLVGDAGGIHNRTEVDINFQTGTVTVTGQQPRYLDELFQEAGKYNPDDWNGHTFKDGTYHTFDFFYLERGGEESNLYIHYNLVSTADFTAHKSFHGTDEDDLLKRDQFQFELIGLDGKYRSVKNNETGMYELVPDANGANAKAIMPKNATAGGNGTVASPYYDGNTTTKVNGVDVGSQTYRTGVTEDGNINFGSADISQEDMLEADQGNAPVYRYIIREIVPDDAVNGEGKTWANATEAERAAGGFVKDDIVYDGTIYYMSGRVTSWTETDANGQEITKHGLSKTYYTDDSFTTVKEDTPFISFVNNYNAKHGNVSISKVDEDRNPLPGAVFALFRDEACRIPAKRIDDDNSPWTATSGADGSVSFENVRVGTYYMKETEAPQGYALDDTIYKVVIEDSEDSSKTSKVTVLGDDSETIVDSIINMEEGKLSLEKKWLNRFGTEISGGDRTAEVNLYRKIDSSTIPSSTTVTVVYHREGATWDLDVGDNKNIVIVEDASSFELDWHLGNDASHILYDLVVNGVSYPDAQDREIDTGAGKITWTPWDGSTSKMSVSDIKGDLNIEFTSNCDWFSEKPKVVNKTEYDASAIDTNPVFVEKLSLSPSNNWNIVKHLGGTISNYSSEGYDFPATDDDGHRYLYYMKELNAQGQEIEIGEEQMDGFVLSGYSPSNNTGVSNQGVITVYNRAEGTEPISVVIKKTDNTENSTNYLEGAVFKLEYRADSSGVFTNVSNTDVTQLDANSQFTVPTAGITLTGLVDGQYRLQEITPPEGYVITNDYPVVFTVSNGTITSTEGTISEVRYTAASTDQNALFVIPNTSGAELPESGGPGTTWIYLIGSLLLIGSGIALVTRRRMRI